MRPRVLRTKSAPVPWRAEARFCPSGLETQPTILRLGDVNGDGFADVGVGVKGGLGVFLGGSRGSFAAASVLPPASAWAFGGDFDGDGYDDGAALLNDGRLAFYFGGASGLSAAPASEALGVFPPDRRDNARGVEPSIRVADFDGDGRADVVGIRPGAAPEGRPELWIVPGATARAAPTLTAVRAWPFAPWVTPHFAWDAIVGPGRSSATTLFVADRGMMAGEVIPVPFRAPTGFVIPSTPARIDDLASSGRAPRAVGDVNGDGFEDMLARMTEDIDGSTDVELFLGTAEGIPTGKGRYLWPRDPTSLDGTTVRFLPLVSGPRE